MSARAEDAARALSREQPTTADAAVPAPANNGSADAEGVEIPAPEPSGNKNLLAASAYTMDAPASTRAATVENTGQQPHRHHMALRSQVSVGGGRSSDNNKDTNKANTTALSRQSSAARDTSPSAAEGATPPTTTPTPPDAAGDAVPTPVHPGDEPPRSLAHEASPRAGEQFLRQVGTLLLKSLSGSARAPFKGAGHAPMDTSLTSSPRGSERQEQRPSPDNTSEMSQDPATAGSGYFCDQDEMLHIRPEDFKHMVRAGATAPPARGVYERPQGDSPLSRASEEGPPPNGRVGPDISQDATMDDFHYAHVLIVEEDEDPAPVLLKAETDRPLVDSVYLAERSGSQRRFTRVRTMGCDGGWIDSRYLLPREEYERQKYERQRAEYERQRRG